MANEETMVTIEVTAEPKAYLVKREDGFHVIDEDGTEGEVLTITKDDKSFVLTPNASNRKWYAVARAEKEAPEIGDMIPLVYKESRHLDGTSTGAPKLPNAKLISYLSEEEQAEYAAIIERARAAKDADKKKPLTEAEKLQRQIEKLQAKLSAMDETEGGN